MDALTGLITYDQRGSRSSGMVNVEEGGLPDHLWKNRGIMNGADRGVLALVLVLLGLLDFFLEHPGYYSGDSGVVRIQAESLISRSFSSLAIRHPGEDFLQGAFQDDDGFLIRQGRALKAVFPPALAAVAALFSKWFGARGLFLFPLLCLAGLVFVLRLFFRDSPAPSSWSLAVLLSSPVLFYGFTLSAHVPAAFFCLLAAALALGPGRGLCSRRPGLFLAGLMTGTAAWFRTEAYCMAPALGIGIIHAHRQRRGRLISTVIYGGGVLAALLPLWVFNAIAYGHPLGLHYAQNAAGPRNWLAAREYIFPRLLAGFQDPWFIIAAVSSLVLVPLVDTGLKSRKTLAAAILPGALILIFFGSRLFARQDFMDSGLFWTMPALVLMPVAVWPRTKTGEERPDLGQGLFLTGVTFLALVLLITPTDGGIQWGPRLLLPGLPLLSLSIFSGVRSRWPRGRPFGVGLALLAGALLAGSAVDYQGLKKMRERENALGSLRELAAETIPDDSAVITDLWWAEQVLPETFFRCRMFYVKTPGSAVRLLSGLIEKGVRDFWLLSGPENQGGVIEPAMSRMEGDVKARVLEKRRHPYHNLILLHLELIAPENRPR